MNILVTGANRGLGLAFVKLGAEKGYRIFAGVRSEDTEYPELEKLQKSYPNLVEIQTLDVSDEGSIEASKGELEKRGVSLDGIINNAGVLIDRGVAFHELNLAEGLATFDINTFGPIRVVKHFYDLLKGEKPFIVNISSDAGSITNTYDGDYFYGMSKAALNMFSEKLRRALPAVRIYSIHPGWLHTDMGGKEAPLSPELSAESIFGIIEGEVSVSPGANTYITYDGKKLDY
ncbi:SDR family oxidoreductase [Evansella tamaricis]|uniref:SDR family oxidoreductase n=1 Tax=Evansella tamaricis TaxID=2069301 RepID=A0ABS6JKC2_9BACI|nr:SDR family oxidoreductase [Evansella tamaricis]MBU9714139.1 SDR family oxidoreductase [Evansella tamaricis]